MFARRLAALLYAGVICLDDLTPAWTGPDREAPLVVEQVLRPLAAGDVPRYHFFDWNDGRYTDWRTVPPHPVLVLEGVGAESRIVRPFLSYLIWVEAPTELRLARGLERDGPDRRPEWERWREREDALFQRERTRDAADLVVDGAPAIPHDPDLDYVRIDAGADR